MVVKKNTILTIFGTRPEAVKLAPVIHELSRHKTDLNSKVVITGQHRFMLDQMLQHFQITPDVDLNLMKRDQTLEQLTINALKKCSEIIRKIKPSMVLVQGDTTTSFVGALAAFYQKIPVGHIEAGLRTYDLMNPYPEEANRRLISVVANWHFAATNLAEKQLIREGVRKSQIFVTGNTVVDSLKKTVAGDFDVSRYVTKKLPFVMFTMHRRESFGPGFFNILSAIDLLTARFPAYRFLYPVHPNPAVKKAVKQVFKKSRKNLCLMKPMDYNAFVNLMAQAKLIITDSGGIQEEAAALQIPTIICREVTERPEALAAGAVLTGSNTRKIVSRAADVLDNRHQHRIHKHCPFGDGLAARRIVEGILWIYGKRSKRPERFRQVGGL